MSDEGQTIGHTTRYDATSAALRHEIAEGRFAGAALLPGERELAAMLNVSRTTLRRAVATLVAEGLLKQRQGMGTFVIGRVERNDPVPTPQGLAREVNLERRATGGQALRAGSELPSPEEAMMLAASPTETILSQSRLLLDGDQPLAIEHAVVPRRLLPEGSPTGLGLAAALAAAGLVPVRALQRVRATLFSEAQAVQLGVSAASAALSVHTTAYLADGQCCLFTRTLYRSDLYDAVFEIRYPVPPPPEPS